ncbi:hypothetical protein [Rhizobacter sp. Root404]|uniref:hypothetical protein n=1 Tax=Rhizobacter sp. Root404 TaxID=1736528 RepID=UPI000AA100C9|nr:hypothetical protein [Rhizobacter sp. Root404]
MEFVEVEEAKNWYVAALDGLRHLETAIHTNTKTRLSEVTLDQVHGMTVREWHEFLNDRELEHEMFASLAVLACFEGIIRRDAENRGAVNKGQQFFHRFHPIASEDHVSIMRIFDLWAAEFSTGHTLRKRVSALKNLYRDRNTLAHGRATRGQFTFDVISEKLEAALKKWKQFVPDFGSL